MKIPETRPSEGSERQHKRTILIVEDEVLLRMLLAEEMLHADHLVIQAASADEAVQLLAAGTTPDLLITDIEMPGVHDGVALARIVRDQHPKARIIFASAHARVAPELMLLSDAMFTKPYDLPKLLFTANALLSQESTRERK
jgi:CheY-like chemotaxis protein